MPPVELLVCKPHGIHMPFSCIYVYVREGYIECSATRVSMYVYVCMYVYVREGYIECSVARAGANVMWRSSVICMCV